MTASITGLLDSLRARKAEVVADCERRLESARRDGREKLTADERAALADVREISNRIRELESERDRAARQRGPAWQ